MKKIIITLAFMGLSVLGLAQENEEINILNDYNKWSIELNGGVNKPTSHFTKGYYTATPSFYHVNLGVRYMINPKFGLKVDGGFDSFKNHESSKEFKTRFYRVSLQGVANLGRIMNFETFTNTFGLLGHAGVGISALTGPVLKNRDHSGHFIVGATGQVKLSRKFVLTGDVSMVNTIRQNKSFDLNTNISYDRGFDGRLYNATVGLTYYIGRNQKHADWVNSNVNNNSSLADRVSQIESMLVDGDNDGVADYLDLEPNSDEGAVVDTRGVTIDSDGNGIPDDIEAYIKKLNLGNGSGSTSSIGNPEVLKQIINSGIINVYFDYDSATPFNASVGGVDFVIEYMKANPNASIDIIGYADPKGSKSYNLSLSKKRADAVKRLITNAGISSSRLNAIGKGVDAEFGNSSISAYQLARRVIFRIK